VAATDARGRVWIAWQAFRRTNSDILALRQEGDGFGREMTVAATPANEWDPAIAASRDGAVAIAWDTYRKGDYDVCLREMAAGDAFGPERAIAASLRYEVRPSLAYDAENRLWIAWEESAERWGKDFGSYESTGTALYQLRSIGLRVLAAGRMLAPAAELADVLPGPGGPASRTPVKLPDPELFKHRDRGWEANAPPLPKNSFPRLAANAEGRIVLAYRVPTFPTWRSTVGAVWFENVVSWDGSRWVGPTLIPNSENLLDNRPAVVALPDNRFVLIYSGDHRRASPAKGAATPQAMTGRVDNDLYDAELQLPPSGANELREAPRSSPASPESETGAERDTVRTLRAYRATVGGRTFRLMRGEFHRHTEISADGVDDGSLADMWRYALDAAALDWIGNADHDNGNGLEYTWWLIQKTTDVFRIGTHFVPMFSYERSVSYPEGHRNVVFARRGIRPLSRLPKVADDAPGGAPDTQMLYRYLRHFDGICASHTSANTMGTDWRDNDPGVEPLVEIYQGDRQSYEMPGSPRAPDAENSIGDLRPKGFISEALKKGYRLGFQASSDHWSTHISYCNLWVEAPTREAMLEAMKQRHVYGSTDNILADVRSGDHFMGDAFETVDPPRLSVKLVGTAKFAKVQVIRDGAYVYTVEPKSVRVSFEWSDAAPRPDQVSYYYVRGEQEDGELVWASPMWIRYRPR
jgi:hypothetical protein